MPSKRGSRPGEVCRRSGAGPPRGGLPFHAGAGRVLPCGHQPAPGPALGPRGGRRLGPALETSRRACHYRSPRRHGARARRAPLCQLLRCPRLGGCASRRMCRVVFRRPERRAGVRRGSRGESFPTKRTVAAPPGTTSSGRPWPRSATSATRRPRISRSRFGTPRSLRDKTKAAGNGRPPSGCLALPRAYREPRRDSRQAGRDEPTGRACRRCTPFRRRSWSCRRWCRS